MKGDLAGFVAARLGEEEAAAKAAGAGKWSGDDGDLYEGTDPGTREQFGETWQPVSPDEYPPDPEKASHIVRHDPARVLREVAAKRARLERYLAQDGYELPPGVADGRDPDEKARDQAVKDALEDEVREDAAIWSGHPDYRQALGLAPRMTGNA